MIIFGGSGLAGSGIKRAFDTESVEYFSPSSLEVNLLDRKAVNSYIKERKPNTIIMAAGVVGGIKENISQQAKFLLENFEINTNVLRASFDCEVPRVIMLSSSCIYPVTATQPLDIQDFLKGSPEVTNAGHAIGKTAASWLIKFYRESFGVDWGTVISSSLYGLEDNFSEKGHVIPALIKKFANSRDLNEVTIWGVGSTKREFTYNDDLGKAIARITNRATMPELINVGSGQEISMIELARKIADLFGFHGQIEFDSTVPAGWPRRVLNSDMIRSEGWSPEVSIEKGLAEVAKYFSLSLNSN
jgi:GDP-L-fucose synthase